MAFLLKRIRKSRDVAVAAQNAKEESGRVLQTPDSAENADQQRVEAEHTFDAIESDLSAAATAIGKQAEDLKHQISEQFSVLEGIRRDGADLRDQATIATQNAGELAASIGELAAASGRISSQVERSTQLSENARTVADEANSGVLDLKSAIGDIANVVRLISDVAKQTNLLALNATIEAARAGEAGKGFAVVASEVKALSVETQKATDVIVSNIDRLQASAEASITSVSRIIDMIGELRPTFADVEQAVSEQLSATHQINERADETARFVQQVASRIGDIEAATAQAEDSGSQAMDAAAKMAQAAAGLGPRFTMMVRQSSIGDRRVEDRLPARINGRLLIRGETHRIETRDISHAGVLLKPEGLEKVPFPAEARLVLDGLGEMDLQIVNRSDNGLHCRFLKMDTATSDALDKRIVRLQGEYSAAVQRAKDGAARISAAMQGLLDSRKLTSSDLFDTSYKPIAGTNPQQFETRALARLEEILPGILEPLLSSEPSMAFCAAVDRNGYLPVHNKVYSKPQKPDDPAWNAANCRNRRIFDDRAGLSAARNSRPVLIQTYARDMGNGNVVWMQEVDVPITVAGRHWGGFRTAYRL